MQKVLTKEEFSEAAFLAGNGTDLQPLLRLNHLLKRTPIRSNSSVSAVTFVSATAGEPKNLHSLLNSLNCKIKKLAEIEPDCLVIAGKPRELSKSELDIGDLKDPVDIFTKQEFNSYVENLIRPYARNSWAAEVIFERGKGTGRFIRFIHIGGEALATLFALSHGGKFVPRFIVTVQTGLLEDPHGPLERMLLRFNNKPEVWVRGRWSHHDYRVRKQETQRLSGGLYSNIVQKFPYWNGSMGCPDEMIASKERYQTQSIVRGFQITPLSNLLDRVVLKNGSCTIRLIKQTLEPKDDMRTIIVSRIVKNRWKNNGHNVSNVLIWENLDGANQNVELQPFTLQTALNILKVDPILRKHYAILPIGFEDEGFRVIEYLYQAKNIEIDIHFQDILDFADLRKSEVSEI